MSEELVGLLDRLEQEHVELRTVLSALRREADAGDLTGLADRLAQASQLLGPVLDAHSEQEDERLFPALGPLLGEGMIRVFSEEHERIRGLRDRVYGDLRRDGVTAGACIDLCELLSDHVDREDGALFPAARGVLSGADPAAGPRAEP